MRLLDVLHAAEDQDESVELALLRETEPEDTLRAAWLLAVTVSVSTTDFKAVLGLDLARDRVRSSDCRP